MKRWFNILAALSLLPIVILPACVTGSEPEVSDEDPELGDVEEDVEEAQQELAYCEGWTPELYQWCLTTCTGGPSGKLWVVGTETQVGGYGKCNDAAEWFCAWNEIGHRKSTCWGYGGG